MNSHNGINDHILSMYFSITCAISHGFETNFTVLDQPEAPYRRIKRLGYLQLTNNFEIWHYGRSYST